MMTASDNQGYKMEKSPIDDGAKQGQGLQFPWKLHIILDNPEYLQIVKWVSDGESFRVLSKDRFANEVMPVFFNSSSYKSFQRSLNLWGFRVLLKGPHRGECFHALFQRGKQDLCGNMKRVKHRGKFSKNGKKASVVISDFKESSAGRVESATHPVTSVHEGEQEQVDAERWLIPGGMVGVRFADVGDQPTFHRRIPPSLLCPHHGINVSCPTNVTISPHLLRALGGLFFEQPHTEYYRQLLRILTSGSPPQSTIGAYTRDGRIDRSFYGLGSNIVQTNFRL
jgi:HSF-type DNA-binding